MKTYEIDGKDLINVFGTETGKAVFKYLLKSYYHPPSFVRGDAYETAYNEGRRIVMIDILDKMAADCLVEADRLLAEVGSL
jgi:hypothetical protein